MRTDTRHDEELDFLSQEPREGIDELYIQKDSMLAITHKYPPAADEEEAKKQTVQGWGVVKLSLAGGSSGHLLHNIAPYVTMDCGLEKCLRE